MHFRFAVDVEVKNDALTQESDPHELAIMLLDSLEDNKLGALSWVLLEYYTLVEE